MGRRVIDAAPADGALYLGSVVHKRARPRRHGMRYRVFSMLVDLDRLDVLDRGLKLFSHNRFNLFSLYDSDFGPRDGTSISAFIRARAERAGVADRVARIRMLAYPRLLGYAFNPLTVYFLEDAEGRTVMVVHEVHNTFGEHHFYDAVVEPEADGSIAHSARKAFYVSPFNTLEGNYRFSIRPPGDEVFVGITLSGVEGGILTAYFEAKRAVLSDRQLGKVALAYPFVTAKVIAGIHWEALKLWLKGVPTTLKVRRNAH